jgi:PAS domain S-box-containing protein
VEVLGRLKKTEVSDFEKEAINELSITPASTEYLSNKLQFRPHKRLKPMEQVFRTSYLAALPLLLICCILNFSISYNIEAANVVVSTEIHASAERLSIANELHFYYRELVTESSRNGTIPVCGEDWAGTDFGSHGTDNDEGKTGRTKMDLEAIEHCQYKPMTLNESANLRPFWSESKLRPRIGKLINALEDYHYLLRFGTTASMGRDVRQYRLLNEPICQILNDPKLPCNHSLLQHYHIEAYGMDELFFRYLSLCKKIEEQPNRIDELSFFDRVLSKAMQKSMDFYVEETKQGLHSAEVNQYVIFFVNLLILLLLYIRAVYTVASFLSSTLSRCRALFLMLPDTALDSSPFIREFLATGIASVEEPIFVAPPQTIWEKISRLWQRKTFQTALTPFGSFQALRIPVITINSNFRITGINDQAEAMLGYNSSELLSEDVEIIFDRSDHEIKTLIKDLFRRNESTVMPLRRKSGESILVDMRASKLDLQNSEHALIFACNITPYVNETKSVTGKALHFQGIFATVAEAIVVCSRDGIIQMINDQAQKLFGYTEEAVKGKSLEFLFPHQGIIERLIIKPTDESRHIQLGNQEALVATVASDQEGVCLCANGAEVPTEFSITKLWAKADEEPDVVCVIRDMSSRKKMEKSFLSAQKEKAANLAKSVFLANMSHELRTPLNGIILTSQLLAEANLSPELQEYVETISCCADSLFSLINDILDFSKIEAGKLDLEDTVFNIVETVEEVVSSVSPQACEKGIELIAVVDPQIPRYLHGDSRRLRQVLLNFLSNAVKFTSIGHVLVTTTLKASEGSQVELLFKYALFFLFSLFFSVRSLSLSLSLSLLCFPLSPSFLSFFSQTHLILRKN